MEWSGTPLEDLAMQAAMGLGLLGIGFLLIGVIFGFSVLVAWVVVLVCGSVDLQGDYSLVALVVGIGEVWRSADD